MTHWLDLMFNTQTRDDIPAVAAKGVVGVLAAAAPVAARKASLLQDGIETTAMCCGVIISILTIISIALSIERKIRIRMHERKHGKILGVKDNL